MNSFDVSPANHLPGKKRILTSTFVQQLILKAILPLSLVLLSYIALAQPWMESLSEQKIDDGELTFFEIQQAFENYWAPFDVKDGHYIDNGERVKAAGWKQFKRWEWFWESRVDPQTGEFPATSAYRELQNYLQSNPSTRGDSDNATMVP